MHGAWCIRKRLKVKPAVSVALPPNCDSSALSTRADTIDATGDGLFLPVRRPGARDPLRLRDHWSVRELRLDVRACVHTGECGLVDGKGGQP